MPGAGPGMQQSAGGGGMMPPGMPQAGRMNARPGLPMGGNGQPEQPPPVLPAMSMGGPTAPGNIEAMLQPQGALPTENAQGMQPGANAGRSGPGQSMPMVMLQLMKALGQI
jgi:hypothetical protein